MGSLRVRSFVACAAFGLGLSLTSLASAAPSPVFNGGCELSGVATFDKPVSNETKKNGGRFKTQPGLGNCVGDLTVGRHELGIASYPVRAVARGVGDFSCASGTLAGRGRIVILDEVGKRLRVRGRPVIFRAGFTMTHAVVGGTVAYSGTQDTLATGIYNFTPSAGAVTNCELAGERSLPMAVRFNTQGDFIGRARRKR